MSAETNSIQINFSRILRAAEGLAQWRAMALGCLTMLASGTLMVLAMYMGTQIRGVGGLVLGGAAALVALVVGAAGFSGVGAMLMDRAKQIAPRSMADALVFGVICLPRFVAFALLLLVIAIGAGLVAGAAYMLCKIPGLGPLLLFIAHPILVLAVGLLFTVITWAVIPLFTPAIWEGRSLKEALAVVWTVARNRLMQTIALLLTLYIVAGLIGALMAAALFPGYMFMTGMAAAILGPDIAAAGGMGIFSLLAGSGASPYLYAGVLGSILLMMIVGAMLAQVLIMGMNLVYLSASEGLDLAESHAAIESKLEQARQKGLEVRERARQAAERARDAGHPAASSPKLATAGPEDANACPNCASACSASDVFCGSCGHKLV